MTLKEFKKYVEAVDSLGESQVAIHITQAQDLVKEWEDKERCWVDYLSGHKR